LTRDCVRETEKGIMQHPGIPNIKDSVSLVGPMDFTGRVAVKPIIYVDGGVRHRPAGSDDDDGGLVVGDGDSAAGMLGGGAPLDILLPRDKNESDLAYVLHHILPADLRRVYAFGFLGGRRDHEWLNLGEFHRFLTGRQDLVVSLDTGHFYAAGTYRFVAHGVFSILTFAPVRLSLHGACRYPIAQQIWPVLTSHGLSNHGWGELELSADGPVLVWSALEP
jgi:thiamine pyrophosphokinase